MKGIIISDIPDNCLECPLGENKSIPIETCVQCKIVQKCVTDAEAESRPEWCPIKATKRCVDCQCYNCGAACDFTQCQGIPSDASNPKEEIEKCYTDKCERFVYDWEKHTEATDYE